MFSKWNNHLYSTTEVELSFNDLEKIVKNIFRMLDFKIIRFKWMKKITLYLNVMNCGAFS